MEEKIREIVAVFLKVPAAQIAANTPIDRTALQSSILLHRMYARLGEEGVVVNDYSGIKLFGDLIRRQGDTGPGSGSPAASAEATASLATASLATASMHGQNGASGAVAGIGIDMEEIAALPRAADLRKESFYVENFTAAEIAYCILQADPYASLTGLWAAKEAIVKADAQFRNRPFHAIEIGHTAEGRPVFPGMGLSISHTGGMAVAVAVRGGMGDGGRGGMGDGGAGAAGARGVAGAGAPGASGAAEASGPAGAGSAARMAWISWIALLLAAAALLVALKH